VRHAVARLVRGGIVAAEEAGGETVYRVLDEKRPVLDYHRNAVIHRFVAPALVAAAARAAGPGADEGDVRERARWLSRLFKLEFMYRVGAPFEDVFEEYLAFLVRLGAVTRADGRLGAGAEPWIVPFLAELLRAYLEAYRLAGETALALPGRSGGAPDRRALAGEALERGRAALLSGGIAVRESLSKATLENAVEWLVAGRLLVEDDDRLSLRDPAALRAIVDGIAPYLAA
jgi:glycerol-3-phosphate O-acyltransferase